MRAGVLNPRAVKTGNAIEGSQAVLYVALVHVKETRLINAALVHCVRRAEVCSSGSHYPT